MAKSVVDREKDKLEKISPRLVIFVLNFFQTCFVEQRLFKIEMNENSVIFVKFFH